MQCHEPGDLLALYGSLRRGEQAYREFALENRLQFVSPCIIAGNLHDFGEWPGLVEGEGRVTGELFRVIELETIGLLDNFEGCNQVNPDEGLFIRRLVPLLEPARKRAFVYFYNQDPACAPVISSGDWIAYIRSKNVHRCSRG